MRISLALTRPHLRHIGVACFTAVALGMALPAAAAPGWPSIGTDAMARYQALSFDDLFAAVATGIRFEPYPGVVRGPEATALARGGNAADQALLLADLLKAKGYRVRFVRGTLSGSNLETLLRGMYPPDLPKTDFPPEYSPFALSSDPSLQQAARDHLWLEVDQGDGSWLPLDPSFPRARIGEAYAKAEARFDTLPDTMYQTVDLSVNEETVAGKKRVLGRLQARTADIGMQPLALTEIGYPRFKPAAEKKRRNAGDLFSGALSGDTTVKEAEPEKPGPPQPLGVMIRRSLSGSRSSQVAGTLLLDDQPGSEIKREWLRFEIRTPGGQPVVIERDLFAVDAPGNSGKRPALFRRFGIVMLPGPLEPDDVDAYATRLGRAIDLKGIRSRLNALADAKSPARDELASASELSDRLGLVTGHLLGLRLAAESTRMTRQMAFASGVSFTQSLPRIIIVSASNGSSSAYEASIDLRLDQVDAWPYPGNPGRLAEHFQTARGIQNTMLESRFLERTLGLKESSNTANLITRIKGGPAAMLTFTAADIGQLGRIEGLSPYSRQLIENSLKAGREVIIPPKPETLAGRSRLGWWERDPQTGRIIGIMDDGLHSAMAEYSVNTEEIGLNEDTGAVIGMIVGAASTETLLAAKVLENGNITPEIVADIEARMKKLKCMSCPEAEAGPSASATLSGTCFEHKKEAKGIEVKTLSFCEKYTKGMMCASSIILSGYKRNEPLTSKNEFDAFAQKLPCDE